MMAGQFNEVIKLYEIIETVNEFGERETEQKLKYTTRAKIETSNGGRGNENNEIVYSHRKTLYVRSYVPIKDTDILEYDKEMWRITNIENRKDYNDKVISVEKVND